MLYNENGHPVESAKQIHSISQPEQEKIEAFYRAVSILGVIYMKNHQNSAQPIL